MGNHLQVLLLTSGLDEKLCPRAVAPTASKGCVFPYDMKSQHAKPFSFGCRLFYAWEGQGSPRQPIKGFLASSKDNLRHSKRTNCTAAQTPLVCFAEGVLFLRLDDGSKRNEANDGASSPVRSCPWTAFGTASLLLYKKYTRCTSDTI